MSLAKSGASCQKIEREPLPRNCTMMGRDWLLGQERCRHSARGVQVKWPVFAGDAGEDFFKFKKDFLLYAAKQNRTSTRNQITKLRENLRGYAKTLVPTSITDISKGLDILEHTCGDSMKVVTHRVNNLLRVGPWPQEGSKECYSRQIKWIINVQENLQEIIELDNYT